MGGVEEGVGSKWREERGNWKNEKILLLNKKVSQFKK